MDTNAQGTRLRKAAVDVNTSTVPQKEDSNTNHSRDVDPYAEPPRSAAMQYFRVFLFGVFFTVSACFIHGAQLLGLPLYFINRNYYYAAMAVTKQYFGLVLTVGTQLWAPTTIRVSGDSSIASQLRATADGRLECDFPERLILIANHQIYTDWLYLWWTAYTAGLHGYIYILLKKSLKWIPMIGPGMQLYSFIFMARKWAEDQQTMRHRLQQLNKPPSDGSPRNPMWLLIFPEGTNLSRNARRSSAKWAEKTGIPDMKYQVLPRSLGLQFCLQEIGQTTEYIYDCTIAYEYIPPGEYGQDIFSLRTVYFQGRPPKSVSMYWRRFKISDIPYNSSEKMEQWALERWREKDELMEQHARTGRFPADPSAVVVEKGAQNDNGYVNTGIRAVNPFEILQIFAPVLGAYFIARILIQLINFAQFGRFSYA